VATFSALMAEVVPDADHVHVVDTELLANARRDGFGGELRQRLRNRIEEIDSRQVDVTVVTCSTVSGEAERLASGLRAPVLRVDRPMVEAAVRCGRRIAVVAAVTSTVEPTCVLVNEAAAQAASEVTVVEVLCLDAWKLFEAGDQVGFLNRVAGAVRDVMAEDQAIDVVMLAQASMAAAASLLVDLTVPVLSSPRLAVERAAALAR
jgi:glutamate racemase